jgi:hypothetical protein
MIWKKYQNELSVLFAFVLMLSGYAYKNSQLSAQLEQRSGANSSMAEIKEVIALKKIWSDKKTTQKIKKLKTLIPESKVTWRSKSKKLTASYKGLTASELNKLVMKILNLAVEIQKLEVKNIASSYDVEFKCKW